MDVVTDTHSIVWYFTNDPMLSKKALDAFEKTTKEGLIIIPAVVLAGILVGYLVGQSVDFCWPSGKFLKSSILTPKMPF